jgi:citrate synthase
MSQARYLTAPEAANELGITLPTLYAYVSRGLIRTVATGGKPRTRRYRAEDVQKLKERQEHRRDPTRAVESALHWGGAGAGVGHYLVSRRPAVLPGF